MNIILEDLVNQVKETSRKVVEELDEEHIPLVIALTPDGIAQIPMVIEDKANFKVTLEMALHHINAFSYIFINEAWTAEGEALTSRILSEGIAISDLPLDDRGEILTITAVEKGKKPTYFLAKIYPAPQGRRLGEWMELAEAFNRLIATNW